MNEICKRKEPDFVDKESAENNEDTKILTILIADETSAIRQRLKSLFESEPGLKVIGTVNNGLDALDTIGALHPDILVLGLKASNIIEIITLINQRYPKTGIIIPFKPENEENALEILRASLNVCILRTTSFISLLHAIREWGQNKTHFWSTGSNRKIEDLAKQKNKLTIDSFKVLTSREREVFDLVTQCLTNAEIAIRLSISRRTVEVHRSNMLKKLGLRTQQEQQPQLIKYALELDIKL
jgi:DNA-binding NarL/FixJ family response regulator